MNTQARPAIVIVAVALAAAAIGAIVILSGVHLKLRSLHGIRLAAFLVGAAMFALALYIFQRTVRRRARLKAIEDLLPRYRVGRANDVFPFDEVDLDGDLPDHLPGSRADFRAATRALLVSLEDEIRQENGRVGRATRPACRRFRLREIGRAQPRRRRVAVRLVTILS